MFRWIYREHGESAALQATAIMQQGLVVDLDAALAVDAARLGLPHSLPLADSVMLATAHAFGATLWTQDADFESIAGVKYRPKRNPRR